jgi:ectoine hydroxylase-related dioxygenase (phytanoyl-CoA dioxygenase family)
VDDPELEAFLSEPHPRVPASELSVPVSEEERSSGALSAATLQHVAETLEAHGVVVLRQAWQADKALVDALVSTIHANYEACGLALREREIDPEEESYAFKQIIHRSMGRFDMQMDEGVAPSPLLASLAEKVFGAWHCRLLERLLGPDYRINFTAALYAAAGCADQEPHADGGHLFHSTHGTSVQAPMHALQLFLPMCEMDAERGPTEFWPGSHLVANTRFADMMPSLVLEASPGDAIVFDFRVVHRGTANRKGRGQWRPILYQTVTRSWFADDFNFPSQSLLAKKKNKQQQQQQQQQADAQWVEGGSPGARTGFVQTKPEDGGGA